MNNLQTDSSVLPRGESSRVEDADLGQEASINFSELGINRYFEQVKEIEEQFKKISKLLKKLKEANEESKNVIKASVMKTIKHEMAKDIEELFQIARTIMPKLKDLDRDNLANRQKPGCGKGSVVELYRSAAIMCLKKKLKHIITDFQDIFELPPGHLSPEGDLELGLLTFLMHSSKFGMKGYHKQLEVIDKEIEKLSKLITKLITKLEGPNEELKTVIKTPDMKTAIKHSMRKSKLKDVDREDANLYCCGILKQVE